MQRALIAASLIFFGASASAQAVPEGRTDALPTIKSASTLVIVPALVRSQSGELVETLQAGDFKLTDNGVEQRVTIENVERQPLAVVVLMQTGGAASRQFANYEKLGTMLDYMMGSSTYRVALATFDSQVEDLWDFTSNVFDLKDGTAHPEQGDSGASIYDAVNYGIDLLKKQPSSSRRILLLFSQPQDVGSKAHVDDVVRRLGENNVTIYSVTFSPEKTWLKDQFTKPRHENSPYQLSPDQPALLHTFDLSTPLGVAIRAMQTNAASTIASLSGGECVEFGGKADLERQLAILANHIPNRYTLTFRPNPDVAGFHSIQVQIPKQPSLTVSFRTSYWETETAH